MFEFFFKYPIPVFRKGKLILLGAWPGGVLILLIVVFAGGLAWLIWRQLPGAAPRVRNWRAWAVWGLEAATVMLLLLLLWEPAITVAELKSEQNIIAVLVDDSRSMAIADAGADGRTTREAAAVKALEDGGLAEEIPDAGVSAGRGIDAAGWAGRPARLGAARRAGCGYAAGRRVDAHQCGTAAVDGGDQRPAGGRGGAAERWRGEFGRNRCGDDQRAAQSQAAGAYDRLRQGEGSARPGDRRCGGRGEGHGGLAHDGHGELSSARIRRTEGNPGCEGWRQAAGVEAGDAGAGWGGVERDHVLQRGRRGGEEHWVPAGAAARGGECGEQRGVAAGGCERGAAANSVRGGRAAVGVQVYPARRGR